MSEESTQRPTRSNLTGRQKRGKNVLAVRMLVARLSWLEAPLRWHAGRVVWDTEEGLVAPGPRELSRAQRTLNRLTEYPHSAKAALGDPEAWRLACQARIERAKQLSALHAPDLEALVQPGRARDAGPLSRLAALLPAEALCRSGLPASPAAALVQSGAHAERQVQTLLLDEEAAPAGRALAALVLGAIHRQGSPRAAAPLPRGADPALRRAYHWGAVQGLPPEPGLAVALLAHERGAELLSRYLRSLASRSILALPPAHVRELLVRGEAPEPVVRCAELAADTERLSDRLLHRPLIEDPKSPFHKATTAESRRSAAESVAELLHLHAWETRDPQVVAEMARWLEQKLALLPLFPALTDSICRVAFAARAFPAEQRADFFRLLSDRHHRLWPPEQFVVSFHRRHPERELGRLDGMLQARWYAELVPLVELALKTRDFHAVREALDLDLHGSLGQLEWASPELFRLTVELARDLEVPGPNYVWNCVHRLLHRLPDLRACRRVVRVLAASLQGCEPEQREWALRSLIDAVWDQQKDLETVFLRLVGFLPRYLAWQKSDRQALSARDELFQSARELYLQVPARADARLDWLLALLTERGQRYERTWSELSALEAGTELGLKLAGENEAAYRMLVRSAMEHGRQINWYQTRSGTDCLLRYPWLLPVFTRLFSLQTGRCARLLTSLARATRFGDEILTPLRTRFPEALETELPAEVETAWQEWLARVPEQAARARLFAHAQLLQGENPLPPTGVRRAVSLPERLREELAHLETRLVQDPARADLHARAETLRARLADPVRLEAQLREEAAERLEIAAAEAQLRLVEHLLDACYRARLEMLAGPLPPDLALTDDLRNAALLTVDIGSNRKHLRRLLRFHFAGDHGWREAHPANAAFLRQLAEQGVNTEAWLGEHPQTYPWADVPGGKVRLWLEQDPIRILQMGNYFDTCLSLGGGNAFSTVANASELNKRVIYAADERGRILGRKLIGVNAEGRLVGFRTYTACTDAKQNEHLARLFRRYCEAFARRCGLELDEKGEVARLFVTDWYNDGIVAWDEDVNGPGCSQSR